MNRNGYSNTNFRDKFVGTQQFLNNPKHLCSTNNDCNTNQVCKISVDGLISYCADAVCKTCTDEQDCLYFDSNGYKCVDFTDYCHLDNDGRPTGGCYLEDERCIISADRTSAICSATECTFTRYGYCNSIVELCTEIGDYDRFECRPFCENTTPGYCLQPDTKCQCDEALRETDSGFKNCRCYPPCNGTYYGHCPYNETCVLVDTKTYECQENCSYSNQDGYCPSGEFCLQHPNNEDIYTCYGNCGTDGNYGVCPLQESCVLDYYNENQYYCSAKCSNDNPDGFCDDFFKVCAEDENGNYKCYQRCEQSSGATGRCPNEDDNIKCVVNLNGKSCCSGECGDIQHCDGFGQCPYEDDLCLLFETESNKYYDCFPACERTTDGNGHCPNDHSCVKVNDSGYECVANCKDVYGYCPDNDTQCIVFDNKYACRYECGHDNNPRYEGYCEDPDTRCIEYQTSYQCLGRCGDDDGKFGYCDERQICHGNSQNKFECDDLCGGDQYGFCYPGQNCIKDNYGEYRCTQQDIVESEDTGLTPLAITGICLAIVAVILMSILFYKS